MDWPSGPIACEVEVVRLAEETLGAVPRAIARFGYDRTDQRVGIVHFGIGAFHRAHMAWYTDAAMDGGDRDWAITGVSLRSDAVARQLNPQDGLYTVVERSAAGAAMRIVGAVGGVLVAGGQADAVVAALASPDAHVASLTVTEKGYCRAANGHIDLALAGEGGFYPLLAAGLRRRRDAGLAGLTLLSCDNLADNGRQLERLLSEYCEANDPALAAWIAAECAFPCTMVDRIVPATGPDDLAMVEGELGCADAAAVMTEPFSQWVIEDRFAGPRPGWERIGAQVVSNVAPYETAKLRMLNGAHSALAYLGLAAGHHFVHEAVVDPAIRPLIERLMREEAAPTIAAAPGQDLPAYADALLARFANPALNHRLAQIAMDGSQKVPQRWLATLAEQQGRGRRCPSILSALAAWLRHLRGNNGPVDDPRGAELRAVWDSAGTDGIVEALFGANGALPSGWRPDAEARALIAANL